MRIFIKLIITLLIIIIGSIIMGIMKGVGVRGAIPMIAVVLGSSAAIRAIWKYNAQEADDATDYPKLEK